MKIENPIVDYLRELLSSGKTTKEKICVASDLKYPTFENTFDRPTVSPMVKKSLKYSGVVPQRIIDEYDVWLTTEYKPKKEKKNGAKTTSRNKNKSKRQDNRVEEASY